MPYAVEPVKVEEAPGLARAMMTAFSRDPHWLLLWPKMSLEEIIDACTQRLPRNLITGRDKKRHQKVVDTETREIVGYARWIIPKDYTSIWPEAQVAEPTEEEARAYEARWKEVTVDGRSKGSQTAMGAEMGPRLEEEEASIMKDESYLSLDYVTTIPAHQGKGVATLLVRSGLVEADKVGLKTFVMSTPAGKKLYEKCGFQLVSTIEQDDSKFGGTGSYVNHFLVRPPGNSDEGYEKK